MVSTGFGVIPVTMNSILWLNTTSTAGHDYVVTPSVDMLYGPGFLDLSRGPINITVPDTNGRYYVLQCMDM